MSSERTLGSGFFSLWDSQTAEQLDAYLTECLASEPAFLDTFATTLEAYCFLIDGSDPEGLCMDSSQLDYTPILSERIERLSTDRASLLPAPATSTTAAAVEGASTDLIDDVSDAASDACGDGTMTSGDLVSYKAAVERLGISPGSALSRTAVIVECGASNDDVLTWLP